MSVAAIITVIVAVCFAVVLRVANGVKIGGMSAADLLHSQYAEPGEGPSADALVACLMDAPSLFDVGQVESFHSTRAIDAAKAGLAKPLLDEGSKGSVTAPVVADSSTATATACVAKRAQDIDGGASCACAPKEVELQRGTGTSSTRDDGPPPPHRVALRHAIALSHSRSAGLSMPASPHGPVSHLAVAASAELETPRSIAPASPALATGAVPVAAAVGEPPPT